MINISQKALHNIISEAIKKVLKEDIDASVNYTFRQTKIDKDKDNGIKQKNGFIVYPWWLNFFPDKKTVLLAQKKISNTNGFNINPQINKIGCMILYPNKLLDENGNISQTSMDVKRIRYVYELIKTVSKLKIDDLSDIITDIYLQAKNKATLEAKKVIEDQENNLWADLCSKLGAEHVKELMETLRASFADSRIIGHPFSYGNRLKAIGQAQKYGTSISFLATAKDWKNMYNRRVNYNARPYYLYVPILPKATYNEADKYARTHGFANGLKDLSPSQKKEIYIQASREKPADYEYIPFYDVSETTLMAYNDDKWKNSIVFENNLYGTPNQFTLDKLSKPDSNGKNELGIALYGNNNYSDPKKVYLSTRLVAIKAGIAPIKPTNDNDDSYEKALYETLQKIGEKLIPLKVGVKKPENVKPLVDSLAELIMMACHINPEAFMYKKNTVDMDEIKGLKIVFNQLIKEILDNLENINESVRSSIYEVLKNPSKWFDNHYKLVIN